MEKYVVSALVGVLIGISILILLANTPTNSYCKNYIIEHQDEIKLVDNSWNNDSTIQHFKIPTVEGYYWGDITIRYYNDNHYNVIFWSDRQKMEDKEFLWRFLWNFKLDKDFDVDVKYREHKGKNVELDVEILKILKNEKRKS